MCFFQTAHPNIIHTNIYVCISTLVKWKSVLILILLLEVLVLVGWCYFYSLVGKSNDCFPGEMDSKARALSRYIQVLTRETDVVRIPSFLPSFHLPFLLIFETPSGVGLAEVNRVCVCVCGSNSLRKFLHLPIYLSLPTYLYLIQINLTCILCLGRILLSNGWPYSFFEILHTYFYKRICDDNKMFPQF